MAKKEPRAYHISIWKNPTPEEINDPMYHHRVMDRMDRTPMEEIDLTPEETIFLMSKLAEIRGRREADGR